MLTRVTATIIKFLFAPNHREIARQNECTLSTTEIPKLKTLFRNGAGFQQGGRSIMAMVVANNTLAMMVLGELNRNNNKLKKDLQKAVDSQHSA